MDDGGHPPMHAVWRRYRRPIALVSLLLSLLLLFARSWRIDYPYSIDFQVYWLAGKRVATGEQKDLYAPGGGPVEGTPMRMPRNEFKNIPAVALVFVPLAMFDYSSAKRIFWLINFAALAGSAFLIGRFLLPIRLGTTVTRTTLAMAVLGVLAPVHIALRHGQTTPLVLMAVAGHLVASKLGRHYSSGALLALAGLVKIPLLVLSCLVAWNREWKTLGAWALVLGTIGLGSLLLFGPELHAQYVEGLTAHAGTVVTGHNNQSIAAVSTRLVESVPSFEWEPQLMGRGAWTVTMIASVMLLAVLLGALVRQRRLRSGADGYVMTSIAVLAFAIVALPIAWDHYFLLLAPGVMLLGGAPTGTSPARRRMFLGLVGVAALALALPTPEWVLAHSDTLGFPAAALMSHYFVGAVIVIFTEAARPWFLKP